MSKNRAYKKVGTNDKDLAKMQEYVRQFVEPIQNSEIWQGILYKNIALSSSNAVLVEHKLNREPQGWIVISKDAQSDIWENKTDVIRKRFISLECSVNVNVDIWIF